MKAAKTKEGVWILPDVGRVAYCPECNDEVISKCGNLNVWHFSHKPNPSCRISSGAISDWHLGWQMKFENTEVFNKDRSRRAYVMLKNGLVIEVQNSPISITEMRAREASWPKMIWLFNLNEANEAGRIDKIDGRLYWKDFKESWMYYTKPAYFDIYDGITIRLNEIDIDRESRWHPVLSARYKQLPFIDFITFLDEHYKDSKQHFHIRSDIYDGNTQTFIDSI